MDGHAEWDSNGQRDGVSEPNGHANVRYEDADECDRDRHRQRDTQWNEESHRHSDANGECKWKPHGECQWDGERYGEQNSEQ